MEQQARGVDLIGSWSLKSFEIRRDDGPAIHPFGAEAQGSLIYTASGRMSAQVMRSDRPTIEAGDQMNATAAEMEANYKGVVSYYGSYELDEAGGFVIHRVEQSLLPNWEGQDQKRFFKLDGDVLTLSTPPTLWGGGGEVVAVLQWERIR